MNKEDKKIIKKFIKSDKYKNMPTIDIEKEKKHFKESGYKSKMFFCKKCKRRVTYFTKIKKDMKNREYLEKGFCSEKCLNN